MRIAHDRRGEGEPLLLVHGLGSRREMWDPVVERLAHERETVAVDLPGFGRSPALGDGRRHDVPGLADALCELLDELGLADAHVAGNSLGGGLALELGRRRRARSVCALSPIGYWSPAELRWCLASVANARRSAELTQSAMPRIAASGIGRRIAMLQMVYRGERMTPEQVVTGVAGLASATGFAEARRTMPEWIAPTPDELECPVTIAWAEHDRLLLTRQAQRARAQLPGAHHVILNGCGHVPCWDEPEFVADVILRASSI